LGSHSVVQQLRTISSFSIPNYYQCCIDYFTKSNWLRLPYFNFFLCN